MNRMLNLIVASALIFQLTGSIARGDVDWELLNTIKVPGTPVDVVVSTRMNRLFVLTNENALQVYLGKDDAGKNQWQKIKLDQKPLDITTSNREQHILVLTEGGRIQVYNLDGDLLGRMKVAPTVRRIELDPSGNYLFLTDSKQDTVQIAFFDFVRDINTTGSPFKGAADAPVVIAEFSDFECFYCKRLTPILDRVLEQYPGQVKIVFKNFPLNGHKNAAMAAQAALAADRQQQFWKFHDRLFDFADQLNEAKIFEIAEEINLDMEQFKKDIGRPDITTKINQDIREGRRAGIRGVPTVFVNGRRLKRHSLEAFASIIEEELAKTKKGAGKSRAKSN